MNYEELIARDPKDLRLLAAKYGIKVGPRSKPETIAKLLIEHITVKPQQTNAMQHPAEAPKEPAKVNTEDEIREAIKHLIAKPAFTVEFPGDDTCIFKCKGAEESIHMSSPLRVIRSKAEGVSRGAIRLIGKKDDQLNPTVNSGIVMMV